MVRRREAAAAVLTALLPVVARCATRNADVGESRVARIEAAVVSFILLYTLLSVSQIAELW